MEYAKLGNTDIEVSKLCVGCMSFGKPGTMHDWTLDETRTEEIVKHALDLGINFFDTANGYSDGTSEEYLGNALRKNVSRDKVVIASKVYFNPGRLSPYPPPLLHIVFLPPHTFLPARQQTQLPDRVH